MKQVEIERIVLSSSKRLAAWLLELAHRLDRDAHMHFFTVEGTRVCEHQMSNKEKVLLVTEDGKEPQTR